MKDMKDMKDIIAKIGEDDGLTDEELRKALDFYADLEEKLRLLGPTFHLAWVVVRRTLDSLESFKFHRNQK